MTTNHSRTSLHVGSSLSGRRVALLALTFAALLASAVFAGAARANLTLIPDSFKADTFKADGVTPDTRSGARPDLAVTTFAFEKGPGDVGVSGHPRDTTIKVPPGFIGYPEDTPKCSRADFDLLNGDTAKSSCPPGSQVGTLAIVAGLLGGDTGNGYQVPIYNLEPPPGVLAELGAFVAMVPVHIQLRIDPETFGLVAEVKKTSQGLSSRIVTTTLWGVPSDPAHNSRRGCGAKDIPFFGCALGTVPRTAFVRNPSRCGVVQRSTFSTNSWQQPGVFIGASYDAPALEGCDRLRFNATAKVASSTAAAGQPTGLSVRLDSPQVTAADSLGTPPIRDVRVELPEGMAISPASADGLAACSDEELGLGTDRPVGCPDASKIGSVLAVSPALRQEVPGDVYLRSQASSDPLSGDMYRLALVLDLPERGLLMKLAGSATADPSTGKLVATFRDNPQLPVSKIDVALKSGARAPLANPEACGDHKATASMTSWASDVPVVSNALLIANGCGPKGFSPMFEAGVDNTTAGAASKFAMTIERPDGDQVVKSVDSVKLPKGLLGMVGRVALCAEARAAAGTCGSESRIGHTQVAAGSGGSPLWVPQAGKEPTAVHLSGPYKGAPYSLSIVVPAQAGPFDLGKVVVRSALRVDPETAQVTSETDPLPHILGGVPLKVREIRVLLDRPGFVRNPTSCAEKQIDGSVASLQGARANVASAFQVRECADLAYKPKLAMRLTGKRQTKTGSHPGLKTVLTQKSGESNISKVQVTLPKSVVLDATNSYDPKLVCDYDAAQRADCPQSSVIGKATANTPVLARPLSGQVHLVQGIKFGPTGNRIRTTPSLLVKLRGEVDVNLRGTTTSRGGRLITNFDTVPDAPVSKFDLTINGGSKGILVVTRTRRAKIDVCNARQVAQVKTTGHNGRQAYYASTVKTPCAKNAKAGKAKKAKRSKVSRAARQRG